MRRGNVASPATRGNALETLPDILHVGSYRLGQRLAALESELVSQPFDEFHLEIAPREVAVPFDEMNLERRHLTAEGRPDADAHRPRDPLAPADPRPHRVDAVGRHQLLVVQSEIRGGKAERSSDP